jgi:hypothetical protein
MSITAAMWLAPAAAVVYLLPSILACAWSSPRTGVIVAVNAGLGWTVIGWVCALRMTVRPAPPAEPTRPGLAGRGRRARIRGFR